MVRKLYLLSLVSVLLLVLMPAKDVFASTQSKLLEVSKQYIGVPYSFGGTTPHGFDCSGYTSYVYDQMGISLPRTTLSQWSAGSSVSKSDLQVGDLVFFKGTYRSGISHVGIYIGDNNMISATSSRGIAIDSLSSSYWGPKYAGAKRVTNFNTANANESEGSKESGWFTDLSKKHAAFEAIKLMTDEDIINGYTDGTFRPDDSITREQAAAIMNRYLNLDASGSTAFSDVSQGERFYEDILAIQKAGIIKGFPDGTFKPEKQMTRTEMALIVARAFELENHPVSNQDMIYKDITENTNYFHEMSLMNAIDRTGIYETNSYDGQTDASRMDFSVAVYNGIQTTSH
ncbi:NlpC/P60 family protein [Halobacillus litoralis]|uniref:C40 family peptidase n=1 Tax=Halobacillus litoralis TaxID=45668 RepID=UPI001CD808CB|nr:C40 family peptidase [Halobacillus litoralis]MCA0969516.1 NlpC/P60 family protein [Halobacillus litoralis]